MKFVPIDLMQRRIDVAREDSDTALFWQLLYAAEQLTKIVVSGLLSCVDDDKQRHRYSQEYRLVRADGIGEWATCLDELLSGPTSQYLSPEIRAFQKELLDAKKEGAWQYEANRLLNDALYVVDYKAEKLPIKTQGRQWFQLFSRLRNKTRGHGAVNAATCSLLSPMLEGSIKLMIDNLSILQLEWAYVRRNLNLKYRVSTISESSISFEPLKKERKLNYTDGVYLNLGPEHRIVRLVFSNPEIDDFFFPNGAFGNNTFECLSYISDTRITPEVTPFLIPAGELPKSATEGLGKLELIDKVFTNIPVNPIVYIPRQELELELDLRLKDERHPVITLIGRGGIGKTSLALSVLSQICKQTCFSVIVWLSARDIDLMLDGPKPVKPSVLNIKDIAKMFCLLLGLKATKGGPDEKELMQRELTRSDVGPTLFVLDNFETVVNPKEVYSWFNTYIRLPNKILITSRSRDFKGDYPIEVRGMNEDEFRLLVCNVAQELDLQNVCDNDDLVQELYTQTDGHPYVAKILLGERLKSKQSGNLKTVLASKDDILTALFERTYASLTPAAKRIFLTVSNWRSTIPEIALEAVLLNSLDQPIDFDDAIDELLKLSLIESIKSEKDHSYFISTPLSASLFGKKKLSVDPLKVAIETDTQLLRSFGAGTLDEIRHGIKPRIARLFTEVAKRISVGKTSLGDYVRVLEFVCSKDSDSWLTLSSLYEEEGLMKEAISAVQKFIENTTTEEKKRQGWRRLVTLYRRTSDAQGEFHALVELCVSPGISFGELGSMVNLIIKLFNDSRLRADEFVKKASIEKIIGVFNERISNEGGPDNYSQLAWLNLFVNNKKKAKEYVLAGLAIDSNHVYCNRLYQKLK